MVAVIVVVVKVLVWDVAIIDMVVVVEVLVIDEWADVEIIVVGVIVNVLKFALAVSYSADTPSDMAVDLFMDALMFGVLPGIGVEVLADGGASIFAVVMTALAFLVPTPLEDFTR